MATFILTVLGTDRPGLVSALAVPIKAHGASWEHGQMSRLAGKFAGIVLVTVADNRFDAVAADLRTLSTQGLQITLERTDEPVVRESQRLHLELLGDDHPGIVAEISGVQFATGKATLNEQAREALARFAGIVAVYPTMKFRIEGHTDNTGSDAINRPLSLNRAGTVRDFLVAQGVPNSSIDMDGLGPDHPVASNDTAEGRARNRRVEIILTGDPVAPKT